MVTRKYLSLERLTEYDELIKGEISTGDASTLSSAKSYTDTEVAKKADKTHTHDDIYYTETEIDAKIGAINTSIGNITSGNTPVKEATHATNADNATSATDAEKLGGQLPSYYAKASDIPTGALADKDIVSESDLDSALAEKVNAASEGNHSHLNKTVLDGITADKVSAWDAAEDNAKAYADSAASTAANTVKNELLNGAGAAYDTLKELGDLIDENVTAIDALEAVASEKADKDHTHDIDAEMSEESENPVQNKVIKEYVDSNKTLRNIEEVTNFAEKNLMTGFYFCLSNPLPDGWYYYQPHKYAGKILYAVIVNYENTAVESQYPIYYPMMFYIHSDENYVNFITYQISGGCAHYQYDIANKTWAEDAALYSADQIDRFLENKVSVPDIAEAGQFLKVKSIDENGKPIEWECTDGSHTHDDTYYTQAQVDAKLSEKANISHTHAISDVSGLQDALDAKQTSLDTHVADTTKHITATERTNWGTAYTHSQASHAPVDAQANVIESIKVNGTAQTITNKSVNITVPTDNKDLTNGAGYITSSAITNKADKATTLSGYGITNAYTKTEVDALVVVDTDLSSTSTKPVQNKVVNKAIVDVTGLISINTGSIDAHTGRISALETKVGDGFEEITSAEIQALFA